MVGRHFDEIVRSLNVDGTRRRVLRILLALPLIGALLALLDSEESSADGSGAGIGGNRNKRRNRTARKHRKSHDPRGDDKCQPKSKARTCADKCGTVRNNCKKRVDCGPCDCQSTCPVCRICDTATLTCVPNPEMVGESCGDGQLCQADGTCACEGESCGACRTCDGEGVCQDCSGCCDGGACVEACDCGEECCDGLCCASGEVCQNEACCTRACTAVACGSGAPETCGVANCGTCTGGETCIAGACEAVCTSDACPQECNCLVRPDGTAICLAAIGGTCTEQCRDDGDCCPGTSCGATPFACGGQFVCFVFGDLCDG